MAKSGLSAFLKVFTLLPRLFVLGISKLASAPWKMIGRFGRDLVRLPEFVGAVFGAAFRKWFSR